MKILLVSSIFPPDIGGPATYTYHLAKSLTKQHKVAVLTFSSRLKEKLGFPVYSLSKNGSALSRQIRLLKKITVLAEGFDLIYCQDPLVVGVASLLVGKFKKKPVIIKFVGDIVWETTRNRGLQDIDLEEFYSQKMHLDRPWWVQAKLQSFVLKNADLIITPAFHLKRFLTNFYRVSQKKIKVIPNGTKIKATKSKKQEIAVTVGRLVSWKNVNEILEAVNTIPGLKYWIIGSGPELSSLKKLAKKLNIKDRVRFFGSLSQKNVKKALSKTSVFVLNSSYEGLPHILLEAAGAKNALVIPRLPGILEVFSEKEAYYFNQNRKDSLRRVLAKAWQDKKKREEYAKRAYRKVKRQFSWDKTYKATENIINQLIK